MNPLERIQNYFTTRKRNERIAAELPEAIDLMVVVMQAGLDFQVALSQYLLRSPAGALKEEWSVCQSEIRMGSSRTEALRHLRDRVTEPSLRETVRAILQSIDLGSSLVGALKAQSQILRQRRLFAAEKRAAVAPLKLMFPLFVFIFPTIFIALLGPVVLTVMAGKQ